MSTIPSHHRVTIQILNHWQPFRDLKLMFVGVALNSYAFAPSSA